MNDFIHIINFAIEREKESIEFYNNLEKKFTEPNIKNYISNIINIEKTHITKLNNIKNQDFINNLKSEIDKIKLEEKSLIDYLNITYISDQDKNYYSELQELLIIAIKKENLSLDLYLKLSEKFSNIKELKNIFFILANEEKEHKKYFENLYNNYILKEF
ncbi:MAG: ferritin family protein [Spirochaetes bacterium]|nr:ferritin family protein [Spirochaetota bacterium]